MNAKGQATRENRSRESDSHRSRVLNLLRLYGRNTTSFQVLEPDLHYWFDENDACVAYAETGGAWVVAGGPISPARRESEVIDRFVAEAARQGKRVRFFGLERDVSSETSLAVMPIGEQPVWDPQQWPQVLREKRSLREQLRRARAKGVRIRRVSAEELRDHSAPTRVALDKMIGRWQQKREMAPMGFVVHLDPYHQPEERTFLVAEHEDAIVGILAAVPIYARKGWFFEDVLRDPAAPNGTMELLFDQAMRMVAGLGSQHVTFGLAPLAGASSKWLRVIRDHTRWLYHFEGLRAFKAKLMPSSWQPVYLGFPKRESGLRAIIDCLRAFARGSFIRFGFETVRHRAPDVAMLLGLLLLPWTLLLMTADTAHWFPNATVQHAWIGLDIFLFAALLRLATKWRRSLAVLLSLIAATDFTLGAAQIWAHNAAGSRPFDWAVITVAQAAPLFASLFLWFCRDWNDLYRHQH